MTIHEAGRVMSRSAAKGKQERRWTCNSRQCEWVQKPNTSAPVGGPKGPCPACGYDRLRKVWVTDEGPETYDEHKD